MAKATQIGLRVPDDLLRQLESECERRGVSLNKEVNRRLRESFASEGQVSQTFESKELFGILEVVAVAMNNAGRFTAFNSTFKMEETARWFDHPVAFAQAVRAATIVFQHLAPPGNPEVQKRWLPEGLIDYDLENIGAAFAHAALEEAATGQSRSQSAGDVERAQRLRQDLGDLSNRLAPFSVLRSEAASFPESMHEPPEAQK